MITTDSLFTKVNAVYDRRRLRARDLAYENAQRVNADAKFARNRELLKKANFLMQKCEFEGDEKNAAIYREEYARLKKEREELLFKAGLSEQALSAVYECPECEDTGFLSDGGCCKCFYSTLKSVINDALGITETQLPSFDDYLCETDEENRLKTKLITFTEKFPELAVKNLILTGNTGSGKTFAARCVANAIQAKNHSIIYLSAVKANDLFLRYHTSDSADKKVLFNLITEVDLLIIDDLGTEPVLKNVTVEYLTSFLSERLNHEKPFIITTNLTPAEIKTRYTERLLSRLSSKQTAFIPFIGKDKRRNAR